MLDFVISPILDLLMAFVGGMVSLVLSVLISIAQFNEFTTATAVTTGWKLVRDICNMFFIVILLIISVGTVLGIQSYSYKNFLKKVILMAILINFSKTIAGFLIDVSQIIMLTFVAAFKDSIIVGFAEAFGINKLKSMSTTMDASGATTKAPFATLLGMILGLVFSVIFLLVLISVVVMLVYRIVILWILVVLSPFAYLASAMPGSLGGQAKQWWSQFTEQLIVGPAIAFFLWLALSVVSATGGKFTNENITSTPSDLIGGSLANASFILNYIIGIVLLVVGMQMAQKMGGKSGAAMGNTFSKAKSYGWKGVKGVGRGIKSTASWAKDSAQDRHAGGREARLKTLEETKNAGGIEGLRAARKIDKLKARDKKRKDWQGGMLKKVGFGENAFEALDVVGNSGLKKVQAEAKANIGSVARAELDGDPDKAKKLQEKEKNEQVKKAEEGAKKKAEKDWEGFSEAKKDTYGGDRNNYSKKLVLEAGAEVKAKDPSEFKKDAENKYIAERGKEAADEAKKEYQKRYLSVFNPLKPALDYAADEGKFKKDAEQSREALISSPGSLTENRFIDKEGKAREGSIKTILGQMSQPEIQNLVNHWIQEEKNGTKDADKVLGNLLAGLKFASEKGLSPAASAVYESLPAGLRVQRLGKSEDLSTIAFVKSKEYLTDIDEEKVLNTATEIENEVDYLGDTKVRADMNDDGWEVDRENSIDGKIALKKEGEKSKEVDKDTFMKHNGSLLADHFYNSDRYERLKADKGEDSLLTREDYNTHTRIKNSSQEGVTLGSFGEGGDWTVLDFDRFNEVTDGMVGSSKAGVTLQGDEAVKAAEGMGVMLDDQVYELENAKTDDEVKGALSKFGYNDIKDGANLDEMKERALKDAEMVKTRLNDKDKIKEEGLILINKQRSAREIRNALRHERAHKLIESVDKDGAMQNEVWEKMSPEEQEEAREYIRKDRNQPDMDESEIKTEYIADAFANTRKPGGPKDGEPKLPPALADRISNSDKMKIDEGDTGATEIKTGFIASRLIARKARKQREADERLAEEKKKITAEWEDNKEENLATVRAKAGNENLTEEEAMRVFMTPKIAKAEEKAKNSMQKSADKHKAKTDKKRAKINKKKEKKEGAYNATEEEINNVRTKFAQRFNTRQTGQRNLNRDAQLLQQEAQEALTAGDEKGYLVKLDEARNKTKQAQALARENISDKKDYDKQLLSLNSKASKAKKETNVITPENDPNVWNDAMSGTGKVGNILYKTGGTQFGVKFVADLALHGLAKVGIAKGLAAKTSDTYKYEMQKRQVNLEKGQFAEIFTELDSVIKMAMDNPEGATGSQKVTKKRDELMKRIDESKSISVEDKVEFKTRINGVVGDMVDGKGSVDSQRFTKANELINAYMKTKVTGASIAKDALNTALIMTTGGMGAGVVSARMAVFTGANMMNAIGKSRANYVKKGEPGSKIGYILKDLTIGSAQDSYKAIAHGQGFKGKAIGALGAVAKLSTAYSISAGLTDSDQFIDAFTQPSAEPASNIFESIEHNLVTNAKAVGDRYVNMPERMKKLFNGPEPAILSASEQSLNQPSVETRPLGVENNDLGVKPSLEVEHPTVVQTRNFSAEQQEAIFAAAMEREASEHIELKLRGVDDQVSNQPIPYIPYENNDYMIDPSSEQLVERGVPEELAKRIDLEVGPKGANSVKFIEKMRRDGSGETQIQWVNNKGQEQSEIYGKTGPQIKIDYGKVPDAPERDYSKYAKMSEQVRSETLSEVYGDKGIKGDISKLVANDGWHSGNGNLEFSKIPNASGRQELIWTDNTGGIRKYEYDNNGTVFQNDQRVEVISDIIPRSDSAQDKAYFEALNTVHNKSTININDLQRELSAKLQGGTLDALPVQDKEAITSFVNNHKAITSSIESTSDAIKVDELEIKALQTKLDGIQSKLSLAQDDVDSRVGDDSIDKWKAESSAMKNKIKVLQDNSNDLKKLYGEQKDEMLQKAVDISDRIDSYDDKVDLDYRTESAPTAVEKVNTGEVNGATSPRPETISADIKQSQPTVGVENLTRKISQNVPTNSSENTPSGANEGSPLDRVTPSVVGKTVSGGVNSNNITNESSLSGVTPTVNTDESTLREVEGLKNNDSATIEHFVGGTDMASRKQLVDKLNNIVNDNTISNEDKIKTLNNIKSELVDRIKMGKGNRGATRQYLSLAKNIDVATNNIEDLPVQSTIEPVAPTTSEVAPKQPQDATHNGVYTTSPKVDFDHMNDSTINALAKGDKEIINQAFGESEYKAGGRIVYIVEKVVNDNNLSLEQKTSIMHNLKEEFVKRNSGNEGQREYRAVMDRLKPDFWGKLRNGS